MQDIAAPAVIGRRAVPDRAPVETGPYATRHGGRVPPKA